MNNKHYDDQWVENINVTDRKPIRCIIKQVWLNKLRKKSVEYNYIYIYKII